jgi:hypothetical protein
MVSSSRNESRRSPLVRERGDGLRWRQAKPREYPGDDAIAASAQKIEGVFENGTDLAAEGFSQ